MGKNRKKEAVHKFSGLPATGPLNGTLVEQLLPFRTRMMVCNLVRARMRMLRCIKNSWRNGDNACSRYHSGLASGKSGVKTCIKKNKARHLVGRLLATSFSMRRQTPRCTRGAHPNRKKARSTVVCQRCCRTASAPEKDRFIGFLWLPKHVQKGKLPTWTLHSRTFVNHITASSVPIA